MTTLILATWIKIATCTAPLIEGEYSIYATKDYSQAKVSYSGVQEFDVIHMNRGPVSFFDFNTPTGAERIIIAVDGGHELHRMDKFTGQFKKITSLKCRK